MTGLPALKLVRRALADHHLVLAADQRFQELLPYIDYLDEIYPSGELMPLTGFGRPVDVAIDLHGNGRASRRLLAELAPGRLIGFGNPGDGLPGPAWDRAEHEVSRWCRLISDTLGAPRAESRPSVEQCVGRPAVDVPRGVTLIHPGAAYQSRRWPPERFTDVSRALVAAGHRVLITGGAAEASLVEIIAGQSGAEPVLQPSLVELFALVASARSVISGDTGVSHVASNYATPSVTLFGPVSPRLWGPPADPRHQVLFHGDGRGNPHGGAVDPALLRISVDEVLSAIGRVAAEPALG
jgi:ADP-heptose:LPS heptosyltransferase